MKPLANLFLILGLLIGSYYSHAQNIKVKEQTEEQAIKEVIDNYIVGTAYNYPDKLRAAFIPNANMFLDHKDKPLFVMTIEEYADRVAKHGEPGKFNGRVTNILSIDRFEGIATAKLEVIIPSFGKRFIDMILLKKLDNGWKIISKTAGSELSVHQGDKALLVLSSTRFHGDSDLPAGNSFSEVVIAYHEYQKAGYHVDIVSPQGGQVPLVYINASDSLQAVHLFDADFMYALQNTQHPSAINAEEYQIIQYTGGSGPIFDIPENKAIQDIAMHIYEKNNGVIAAVCHGTAGIVHLKQADGTYLVAGKKVNGFPDDHERKDLPYYEHVPFVIEQVLKENGGIFKFGEQQVGYMEVDGRLVTGQNWQSSGMVTRKSIELMKRED